MVAGFESDSPGMEGDYLDVSGISALVCVTVMNLWENLCGEKRFSSKAVER